VPLTILKFLKTGAVRSKRTSKSAALVPRDFAVRDMRARLVRNHVHRIPRPTFVTIAKRLSARVRDRNRDIAASYPSAEIISENPKSTRQ
jgi:hypothetical protein